MAFKFEVEQNIGKFSTNEDSEWVKEVNVVSFNGKKAKLDIRSWTKDHERMGKGIQIEEDEIDSLIELLQNYKNNI